MKTLLMAVLLLAAPAAQEQVRYPAKPGPREFILDEAKVIKPDQAAEIRILCDEALTKKKAPIVVVTIPSLASYGAAGWPIERYALNLMSEWGVGWADWNYGMLLLVSTGDRKARIDLGGSWERRKDDDAKRVMREQIIPHFKKGDYSKGILEGVRGMQAIALDAVPSRSSGSTRTMPVPVESPRASPIPGSSSSGGSGVAWGGCGLILLIAVGLIVVMGVSRLFRRGAVDTWGNRGPGYYGGGYGGGYYGGGGGGFGSSFGGGILGGALGSMLGNSLSRRMDSSTTPGPSSSSSMFGDSSSSGGGGDSDFGGGSFGGGFSGGGGATGEW
jgi:uncharacterized protein